MTGLGVFLVAALLAQSPAADSLRATAAAAPPSALVAAARERPGVVREAVSGAYHASLRGSTTARTQARRAAQALAEAEALAWRDSFLLTDVARVFAWPAARREARVWGDSVRRAGVAAYGRRGPAAALDLWRPAVARATRARDSVGLAAVLGNVAVAHLALGQPDSAAPRLHEAAELARAVGDRRVEVNALGALAALEQRRGQLAAAARGYERTRRLREAIGDRRGLAADLNNLGVLARSGGDPDAAREHFRAALAINRSEGWLDKAATNLVNLADLAAEAGAEAEARALYREALGTWRARGDAVEAASALHGLGRLAVRAGDYHEAERLLREALMTYRAAGQVPDAVAVHRALAGVRAALGEVQAALDEVRAAERLADSAGASPALAAGLALTGADLQLQFNDFAAAEAGYRRAMALYRSAGDPAGRAEATQGLAALLVERGDLDRAGSLLDEALAVQEGAGLRRSAALTRLQLGRLAAAGGDTAVGLSHLVAADEALERLGDPVARAAVLAERGHLELPARPVLATAHLEEALRLLDGLVAPQVAWTVHAGLARAWVVRGEPDRAAAAFRTAIAEAERPALTLAAPERRSAFLDDKWTLYAELATLEVERGRPAEAFVLSERMRARQMLEVLARGPRAVATLVPADLMARERELRVRMAGMTRLGVLPAGGTLRGPDLGRPMPEAVEALDRAQRAYADLLEELGDRAPREAGLVNPPPAEWRGVAARLAANEAVVEYLMADDATLAFVITRSALRTVRLGASRGDLARLVEFARGAIEARGDGAREALWRGPLRRLHRHLIAPLEASGALAGVERLILVPHGELHYLPFAALLDERRGDRYLVERYELGQVPSAGVWGALDRRSVGPPAGGLLAYAPRVDRLPGSGREAAAASRLRGAGTEARLGRRATEAAFRREAPGHGEVHLATYGVLNRGNPLFSYVELFPGEGHDGRLEVHEILGLDLAADLVVLSACQTGVASGSRADVPAGDDWVGLVRAFLHAGAARVIATLWSVEDAPTTVLMERFYGEYAEGRDAVASLARAQRAAIRSRATAAPFAWAGFVIVGEVGRNAASAPAGRPTRTVAGAGGGS